MEKLKRFIFTTLLGGLVVVLPVAIIAFVFHWMFGIVAGLISPVTGLFGPTSRPQEILLNIMVIAGMLLICFIIGFLVRTRMGGFIYRFLEKTILARVPGYSLVKETVLQFAGSKRSPFSSVALADIYGNGTLVTAFVTDEHDDGRYTVFVPTGPNPTSGNIFHLDGARVHRVDVPVEDAMRSIISCGSSSRKVLAAKGAPGKSGR